MTIRDPDNTFLMLNGVAIPVAAGSADVKNVELGNRSRAYSGRYLQSRRKIKKEYNFQTCIIPPEQGNEIQGMIMGTGQSFPFCGTTDSVKGAGAGSPFYLLPRKGVDGCAIQGMSSVTDERFGACLQPYQGVSPNNDLYFEDAGFLPTAPTNIAPYTKKGLFPRDSGKNLIQVNYSSAGFAEIDVFLPNIIFFSVPYQVCFYYKILSKTSVAPDFNLTIYSPSPPVTGPTVTGTTELNTWNKVVVTYPTSVPGRLTQSIKITAAAGSGSLVIGGAVGVHPSGQTIVPLTTLTDGFRDPMRFSDMKCSSGDFTYSFWFQGTSGDDEVFALVSEDGCSEFIMAYNSATNELTFTREAVDGAALATESFTTTVPELADLTRWHLLTVTYEACKKNCPERATLYVNGGQHIVHDWDEAPAFDATELDVIYLGDTTRARVANPDIISTFYNSNVFCMDDLQVLPYAVQPDTVKAWYRGNAPMGRAPEMTMQGLYDDRCEVKVMGQVSNVDCVGYARPDGTWEPSGQRLNIKLFEV